MLQSSQALRLSRAGAHLRGKRLASHGAPQFNEPSGLIFGEKVGIHLVQRTSKLMSVLSATSARRETGEGGLGEYLVYWDVRNNGFCFCHVVLQAGHEVRCCVLGTIVGCG